MIMAKNYCAGLILLIIHFGSILVKGQSTVGDCSNDEQDTVNDLTRFVKDLNLHKSDALITLTKSIQLEFQNLRAQISRLEDRDERHETYMKSSIEEIKSQVQTANNDTKAQISRLENRIERHSIYSNNSLLENRRQMQTGNIDTKAQISRLENRIESHSTYLNNSLLENRRQMQTGNIDTKAQISHLENRIESHNTYMNNSLQENKRQMQTGNIDTKAQISRLENRIESHNTYMNNSLQENKRQMQTGNIDTKAQISRLENRVESHNTYLSKSVEEIKRQLRTENMEIKNEFQGLTQKLSSHRCPSGFDDSYANNGKCYAVLDQKVDWGTARRRCRALNSNAHLAVITNESENQHINEILQNHNCNETYLGPPGWEKHSYTFEGFWIGGQLENITNCNSTFLWKPIDGLSQPVRYKDWQSYEPNCGFKLEACLALRKYVHPEIKWNDLMCSWPLCSICEARADTLIK